MLPAGVGVGAGTEGDCEGEPPLCPLEEPLELPGREVEAEELDDPDEDGRCPLEELLAPPEDEPPALPADEFSAFDEAPPAPDGCVSAVAWPVDSVADSSSEVSVEPAAPAEEPALFWPAAEEDEFSFSNVSIGRIRALPVKIKTRTRTISPVSRQ